LEQAATRLQSGVRGREARKQVEEAKKSKAAADAAKEAARREQADKEKLAAAKAAEAKAAEAEAAEAAAQENKAEREASGMLQRQKDQAAAREVSRANAVSPGGRASRRRSLKEQTTATKLAATQATDAEGHAAAATREVAAAHAELKKRGSSRVLEENLAEAEEKQGQLAALGAAKAAIARAEQVSPSPCPCPSPNPDPDPSPNPNPDPNQARLDAMKAADTADGEAPFDP